MITRHDETLFSRAVTFAREGEHHRVRVGAVLHSEHRPLAIAWNVVGPVPNEPYYPGHAEQQLLHLAEHKSNLYVARLSLSDELLASRPCRTCLAAIVENGNIEHVIYWDGTEIVKEPIK